MISSNLPSEIHVGIGEIKRGDTPQVLKAILGSCVGIGFMVPSLKLYALAHCFLPYPKEDLNDTTARYVTHAIPALFKILGLGRHDSHLIQAVIAGGASMHGQSNTKILRIGEMNVEATLKTLREFKVHIVHQEIGSDHGRQLILRCEDNSYSIRNLLEN